MIPSPHDLLQHPDVQQLIARALEEDLGPGDVTSEAMVPPGTEAAARLIARQACRCAWVASSSFFSSGSVMPCSIAFCNSLAFALLVAMASRFTNVNP